MKNIQRGVFALLVALCMTIYGCGAPNDKSGGMDQDNSKGEGSVDSTRLTNFDSTSAANGADTSNIK